jgi:hypothetical protein
MQYLTLEKPFISWHNLHRHWYTCPIVLPVRQNPQHRSLCFCCSLNRANWLGIIWDFQMSFRDSRPSCEPLYMAIISHHEQETFLYEYALHRVLLTQKKKKKRTTQRCSSAAHTSSTVAINYWNQPMHICYLDCHEVGMCCYLVIHKENYYIHYSCFTLICDLVTVGVMGAARWTHKTPFIF